MESSGHLIGAGLTAWLVIGHMVAVDYDLRFRKGAEERFGKLGVLLVAVQGSMIALGWPAYYLSMLMKK